MRVLGNADEARVLLPARLLMDTWSEPDYSEEVMRTRHGAVGRLEPPRFASSAL